MIYETLVTTQNEDGLAHIAPMGIHRHGDEYVILPFRPSTTLANILATGVAVLNYSDDVRVFAGCLTGRRDWPLTAAVKINAPILADSLAHTELQLLRVDEDEIRPKLFCTAVHHVNHAPFQGFNRAQFAVLEAAILVSRLSMLPPEKITAELDYLRIGFEKTAGERERIAWDWLMAAIDDFNKANSK